MLRSDAMKLGRKLLVVVALAASAMMLNQAPMSVAQAADWTCQANCGRAAGECHRWCSTNWNCHQACDWQYQQCVASCQ